MHFFSSIEKKQRFRDVRSDHCCLSDKHSHLFAQFFCIDRVFLPIITHDRVNEDFCFFFLKSLYKIHRLVCLCSISQESCINAIRVKIHLLPFVHQDIHTVCIIITIIRRKTGLCTQNSSRKRTCLHPHHRDHRYRCCQGAFSHPGQVIENCNFLQSIVSLSCFLSYSDLE